MSNRVTVSFDRAYLAGLDDTTQNVTTFTELETGIALQCLLLLKNRYLWDEMTNAEWDDLDGQISATINKVYVP